MIETDCPTCKYPTENTRNRLTAEFQDGPLQPLNTFFVPNYGNIPIIKGDLTWLNGFVMNFIKEAAEILKPARIRICNGSVFEASDLKDAVIAEHRDEDQKELNRLAQKSSYDGDDEFHVYTGNKADRRSAGSGEPCTVRKSRSASARRSDDMASPCDVVIGDWMSKANFEASKEQRFPSSMQGRTMYVVPFAMGIIGGRITMYGVQITDDPIVVLNLRCIFRVSSSVWDAIGTSRHFLKIVHSIGEPRPVIRCLAKQKGRETSAGSYILQEVEQNRLWVYGCAFGRNDRISKTISVRAVQMIANKYGWLAENAAILEIVDPNNQSIFACYASLDGASSLHQLKNDALPGWRINVISQGGAVWIHWKDEKMYASAPENDEMKSSASLENLNRLVASGGAAAKDYDILAWNPQQTVWSNDLGVPIAAYIFGTRRADSIPLIFEANRWQEGVVLAAGIRCATLKKAVSPTTQSPELGALVHHPMVTIKEHLSQNFTKYVEHWCAMGFSCSVHEEKKAVPPLLFFANFHQQDELGKTIWPGGQENLRVFEHIFKRCQKPADLSIVDQKAIGRLPKALNTAGLPETFNPAPLFSINSVFWLEELAAIKLYLDDQMKQNRPKFVDHVLAEMSTKI